MEEKMYKSVSFYAAFNERTGYGVHANRLCEALEKLIPVYRNQPNGEVSISLLDTVTASQTMTFPPKPSILFNIWEASEQPAAFIEKLKNYSQLWVGSEAQRAWSISQGVPEEFVFVVPEGVDPEVYHPVHIIDPPIQSTFDFLVCGQWQRRKSTIEIVRAFLKAFPKNKKVRLYLSTDTLFPSDTYKSTEERLAGNGIFDERIIPVHFEEREAYVRRLQTCHVYVQCSRSEGFGLPGIEAMACGAVSILENWGGSTEYSSGALLVNVPKLEKPAEIYGNWPVPGLWGSPDYDHLVEVMRDAYKNYSTHKKKALITSEMIRTKFSWEAAAKKAYDILDELSQVSRETVAPVDNLVDAEKSIHAYARKFGYDIASMHKRKAIFAVDCHPDSQEKLDTLVETVKQVRACGYPVLIVSHLPLPIPVIELADYYIYDKNDVLSGDDKPVYWRQNADGTTETTEATISCHALAGLHNARNTIDFCFGKFDWIYHMNSDCEVDLPLWLDKVRSSEKPVIACHWDNNKETFGGQIIAAKTELFAKIYPRIETWDEFRTIFGDDRFCSEKGFYKIAVKEVGLENIEFLDIDLGNRFDQVDRGAWGEDRFECHFVDGPYLNIAGMSGKEYDVSYSNPIDGESYRVAQKSGMWSRPSKKFYRDWTIKVSLGGEVKFEHHLDLAGKNVIISLGSKAHGDTLAWIPYIEEFRKKHNCTVYCSTWWNHILDYPEIKFIMPGDTVQNVYASYSVGCFDDQLDLNPINWRLSPLQKVAADILGLEYEPIRAKLKCEKRKSGSNGNEAKPYICFSEFSTMQNKLWNRPGAWQKVIDYLNKVGYDCISISAEPSQLQGIIKHNGQSIEQTITDIAGATFYIGLNAGPSWLAYSLNIPCIMITGVSEPWNDFPNPHRISVDVCRPGCFNDPTLPIDRGWNWCPRNKDYACTREITESMVIEQIDNIREVISCQSPSLKKTVTKSEPQTKSMRKGQASKKQKPRKGSLMRSNMVGPPATV